jgi:hypothetical protein
VGSSWPEAQACFERAEQLLADARASYCRAELDGAQSYGITVLVLLGRPAEAQKRHAELRREAEGRGDLFLGTNLSIGLHAQCWLFDDKPMLARAQAAEAMARWSPAGFHLQHWHELTALTAIDLYEGHAEPALERLRTRFRALERSMLLRIEYIRMYAVARACLARHCRAAHSALGRCVSRCIRAWHARYGCVTVPPAHVLFAHPDLPYRAWAATSVREGEHVPAQGRRARACAVSSLTRTWRSDARVVRHVASLSTRKTVRVCAIPDS